MESSLARGYSQSCSGYRKGFLRGLTAKKVGYRRVITRKLQPFSFDHWDYFELCVNHLKIAPSEAWRMSYIEILNLLKSEPTTEVDLSFLLGFERKENGGDVSLLNH